MKITVLRDQEPTLVEFDWDPALDAHWFVFHVEPAGDLSIMRVVHASGCVVLQAHESFAAGQWLRALHA